VHEERCSRCGTAAVGAYCHACGARVEPPPLRLRPFLAEAASDLLSLERNLFRTLPALLFKPGFLTGEFRAGRGALYAPPLRLYLATAFVYFGGLTLLRVDRLYLWTLVVTPSSGVLPAWISQVVLLGVPLVALVLRGYFFDQERPYVELLVFALYFQSAMFLIGIPLTLIASGIALPANGEGEPNAVFALIAGAWLYAGLRRLTGCGRLRCLGGVILVSAVYLAAMVGAILVWVLLAS